MEARARGGQPFRSLGVVARRCVCVEAGVIDEKRASSAPILWIRGLRQCRPRKAHVAALAR
jgi:hypothetical protein